ncbi:unnamed protein product [Hermetia illucens]|uniref:Peptidase S1 domain-containing protein n=1 Tax=Hermetia illucens TaxID=343691 RepID=A0A7R8UPH1_HERIL|nr:unnamed protein product [Hermetia illucens]
MMASVNPPMKTRCSLLFWRDLRQHMERPWAPIVLKKYVSECTGKYSKEKPGVLCFKNVVAGEQLTDIDLDDVYATVLCNFKFSGVLVRPKLKDLTVGSERVYEVTAESVAYHSDWINDVIGRKRFHQYFVLAGDVTWGHVKTRFSQTRNITHLIQHPGSYRDGFDLDDIAVLKVNQSFDENYYVVSIELSSEPPDIGVQCTILGWSQAGVDPGGPLICNNKLAGVHTRANRDCDNQTYGSYFMNVAFYRDWITRTIEWDGYGAEPEARTAEYRFGGAANRNVFKFIIYLVTQMLRILNESFVANCAIRTIPIWKGQRIDGLECIVAGWGRSQKASYELQLQRISMTIQSHDNCMKLAKTLEEQGSLLCAKDSASNGSLCYGDVGAALICEEEVAAISIYLVLSCGDNKTGTFFQEIGSSSEWFDAIVNWSGRGAMPKPKWKHFKQNEAIVKIKPFWLAPMVILVYLIPLR